MAFSIGYKIYSFWSPEVFCVTKLIEIVEKLHAFGVVIGPKCCVKQDTSEFSIDFKAEIAYCHLVLNEPFCTELRDVVFMHQKTFSEGLICHCEFLSVGMGLSCIYGL